MLAEDLVTWLKARTELSEDEITELQVQAPAEDKIGIAVNVSEPIPRRDTYGPMGSLADSDVILVVVGRVHSLIRNRTRFLINELDEFNATIGSTRVQIAEVISQSYDYDSDRGIEESRITFTFTTYR